MKLKLKQKFAKKFNISQCLPKYRFISLKLFYTNSHIISFTVQQCIVMLYNEKKGCFYKRNLCFS